MNKLFIGDCREVLSTLPEKSIQAVVTSPPYYGLRDYGVAGQLGQESSVEEYVNNLVEVFRKVWRVLKDDGTVWLNLGDCYAGSGKGRNANGTNGKIKNDSLESGYTGRHIGILNKTPISDVLKPKDLIGIPWRVALALQSDGWFLRNDIIWHKPNTMPEAVKDRCVSSHEHIFLLSKNKKYYFDYQAIQENSQSFENRAHGIVRNRELGYKSKLNAMYPEYNFRRNDKRDCNKNINPQKRLNRKDSSYDISKRRKRDVWSINTSPYKGAHFAVFPPTLIEPCVLAGSKKGDIVLDPFFGSGTVAEVATRLERKWVGIDINKEYENLYKQRISLLEN